MTSLRSSLKDLDANLMRIKAGSVYEIAARMDPTYDNARAIRIGSSLASGIVKMKYCR